MDAIAEGATSFLVTEYKYMGVFMAFFSVFIFVLLSSEDGFSTAWHLDKKTGIERAPALYNGAFSTLAFFVGAATSILSGFLGMKIATFANARTALEARKGIAPAFMCAFRAGAVMGFTLAGLGLVVLSGLIFLFRAVYGDDWVGCYEALTGELVVAEGSPLSFSFFGVERERERERGGKRSGARGEKWSGTPKENTYSLSLSLSLFLLFLSLSPSLPLPLFPSPSLPFSLFLLLPPRTLRLRPWRLLNRALRSRRRRHLHQGRRRRRRPRRQGREGHPGG
jgi:Inorganic H+ pyrophosphatase